GVGAQIESQNGDSLRLKYVTHLLRVQRRHAPRVPAQLPIAFRSHHEDGSCGPWHEATTIDISLYGMLISSAPEAPKASDISLWLPTAQETHEQDPEGARLLDLCGESGSIRLLAKLARTSKMCGGWQAGVTFTTCCADDRLRLMRFTDVTAQSSG